MVVIHSGDVILDHYPLGYPLLNKEQFQMQKGAKLKTNCHGIPSQFTPHSINVSQDSGDLSMHTSNIPDLLALIYHGLLMQSQITAVG